MEDAQKLLARAGYALSPGNDFDLIVKHFIATKNFSTVEFNDELGKRNMKYIFSDKVER